MTACSDFFDEPLAGTAVEANRWVCVEFTHGWGHDALDGQALGNDLAQRMKDHMNAHDARFQFMREPGREGQHDATAHRVFIAESVSGSEAVYTFTIDRVADLLDLDISHPDTIPGARTVDGPVALICTHGKRDVCCALKGRPAAALLSEHVHNGDATEASATTSVQVWETSHTGGHRFAPALIALPWGFTFGRANPVQAREIWDDLVQGRVHLDLYRGRSSFSKPGQAAEVVVRSRFHLDGIDDIVGVEDEGDSVYRVECADGTTHRVRAELTVSELPPRPASCGKGDKEVKVFRTELI